jgi:hypothetical protein
MCQDSTLNFNELGWEPRNLEHLDVPFTKDEIKEAIMSAPKEKVPGPYGFIGLFFSACWNTTKSDLTNVVQHFYLMNHQGLHMLNQAFVVLVPKKRNATRVSDFRPISLIAKLISKPLPNRLGLELHQLVSINQTTYIKQRCIHDKFVFV